MKPGEDPGVGALEAAEKGGNGSQALPSEQRDLGTRWAETHTLITSCRWSLACLLGLTTRTTKYCQE